MYKNLQRNLSSHFEFDTQEWRDIFVSVLVLGFVLSFREWGVSEVSVVAGVSSWVLSSVLMFLVLILYLSVVKSVAIWKGYKAQFKTGLPVLAAAVFIAFMFEGGLVFLVPGGLYFSVLKNAKLGKLWQDIEYRNFGYIGIVGALVLVILAALVVPFSSILVFQKLIFICLVFAMYTLLPVPYNPGFYLLVTSFLSFSFLLMFVTIASLFVFLELGLIYSLIMALLCGLCAWGLTYKYL